MSKTLLGLLLGGILGIFDGMTAAFEFGFNRKLMEIVFYSTIKGLITGIAIGYFARKVRNLPLGVLFGLLVGLGLAFLVALMPDPETGKHYYFQIMLPGSILGLIVGLATQKFGQAPEAAPSAASK